MTTDLEPPIGDGEPLPPTQAQAGSGESRPMRVWPVFAIYVGALVVSAVVQIPVVVAIIAWDIAHGAGPPSSAGFLQTPQRFVAVALPAQVSILAVWWLASTYGDPRARRFRSIGRASLGVASYLCFLMATIAVLWLGDLLSTAAAQVLGNWEQGMFATLYENMTGVAGIVFVLFIALVPGVVEELFFRGYMQRRLLARWSPMVAISVVALLFAAMHGTPLWALAVLPLGFWLGILAWRTGSLLPGMLCHGFINGSVNAWRVGAQMKLWPEQLSPAVAYAGIGVCLACLLASLWVLYQYRTERPAVAEGGSSSV